MQATHFEWGIRSAFDRVASIGEGQVEKPWVLVIGGHEEYGPWRAGPAANNPGRERVYRRRSDHRDEATALAANGIDRGASCGFPAVADP